MSSVKKIVRKVIPKKALKKVESTYRIQKARAAIVLQGSPAKKMRVIAVTGTNGKTTTCAYINEILKAGGYKTAVFTTAFTEINGLRQANNFHVTVVHVWTLQKFFNQAKKAAVDWVVLEVTSHALDQHKVLGVPVEIAAVTNLTQDHLDYHGTMENYALAKARLITEFKPKTTVLNADDAWFEFFARKVKNGLLTIGHGKATNQIKELELTPKGTVFSLIGAKGVLKVKTHLVGEFNVYNAAMAATVGEAVGIKTDKIEVGIANVPLVPGRMEPIDAGQPFMVLVDFAVTPDALEKVLTTLKVVAKGRVRIVFGATGDRDKAKRPIMGEITAKLADYIYLTDDETYTEDGDSIRAAVKGGILKAGGVEKFVEIADRLEAIRRAFKDAKEGDIVVLTGIGHENYRNQGGKKIPWDEREVARQVLEEIKY
ncbi:MAG TPA: UDP-N-acetylmuramoyl-L-alanyl-D-glutamate--2,6-diaminopimelate ligase [Patescibacteria group bacterium]|nr:UDP-N-acetylmuramoyl-L-alanyl-D-glutamate--2,6-diaminopimelate ligase [Patescibacteria group bacterium]